MPVGDYHQQYGPIHRRRRYGQMPEAEPHALPTDPVAETARQRVARRRGQRQARARRPGWLLRSLLGMGLLLAALTLAAPYALHVAYLGRALPGVSIQGVPVDDLTPETIQATLDARYGDFARQPLTLTYIDQTWQPTPADLGLAFDLQQPIADALAVGRTGDPLTRLRTLWQLWQAGVDIAPRLNVDARQVQGYLLALSQELDQPPRDAALSITQAGVVGTPALTGRQVLVDASADDMLAALRTLEPHDLTLRTRELPPVIGNEALAAARAQAEELLATPVALTHADETWMWDRAQLASLLRVRPADTRLEIIVDAEQLRRAVDQLALAVDTGTVEPRLRFIGGGLEVIQPGQVGWELQPDVAFQVISTTLQTSQETTRTATLPANELRPQVTPEQLSELGIHELVAQGDSSFVGSADYRITNIDVGAARMDGVLIAPGEEFSFNTQLGEVTPDNGFVEGYAVVGNRTKLEWGGGVCQVSTTVFRAAFWGGLPFTERHAHPFYISWYDRFGLGPYGDGAGLDAAIYTGLNDLKFINDTGNWLLMQVAIDQANQVLSVQLYGSNPKGRTVEIDGPYVSNQVAPPASPVYIDDASKPAGYFSQSDVARSGRDIGITRVVYEQGAEVQRDSFFTRFKAWPNVFVRGTGRG